MAANSFVQKFLSRVFGTTAGPAESAPPPEPAFDASGMTPDERGHMLLDLLFASINAEPDSQAKCFALIGAGATLDVRSAEGYTPLHLAAGHSLEKIVQALIAAGAPLEARDNKGNTPLLHIAHYGHGQVCRILLEAGADMDAVNNQGMGAEHIAEDNWSHSFMIEFEKAMPAWQEKRAARETAAREAREREQTAARKVFADGLSAGAIGRIILRPRGTPSKQS